MGWSMRSPGVLLPDDGARGLSFDFEICWMTQPSHQVPLNKSVTSFPCRRSLDWRVLFLLFVICIGTIFEEKVLAILSPSPIGSSPTSADLPVIPLRQVEVPDGNETVHKNIVLDAIEVAETLRVASQTVPTAAVGQGDRTKLLVGVWHQNENGDERLLTIRPDGTAVMVAHPTGAWRFLLGNRLEIEFAWRLEEASVEFEVTGGSPSDKVRVAAKLWGNHREQRLLELTEQRLLLGSVTGDPELPWERLPAGLAVRTAAAIAR